MPAGAVLPTHVRQCAGTGGKKWWIYTWKTGAPEQKTRVPFLCGSWRCPYCAENEAAVTYARIRDACAPLDGDGFCFFVLTLDRNGTLGGKPFDNATEAYRELGYQSERFLARLRRWCIARGWFRWEPRLDSQKRGGIKWTKRSIVESQWVAVVEAHRSHWPHLNLLVYAPELAAWLEGERLERLKNGATERGATLIHGDVARMAVEAGWGAQSTAEQVRDRDAIAGYITKLAGLSDSAGGEIAKLTQAPLTAPERFRRLRSGKGFLPPRQGTPEGVTGTLVRRITEPDGTVTVRPLHEVSEEMRGDVLASCYVEQEIAIRELSKDAALAKWNADMDRALRENTATPERPPVDVPAVSTWKAPAVEADTAPREGFKVEKRGNWTVYTRDARVDREKAREAKRSDAAKDPREQVKPDAAKPEQQRGGAWTPGVLFGGRAGVGGRFDDDGRWHGDDAHKKRGPSG